MFGQTLSALQSTRGAPVRLAIFGALVRDTPVAKLAVRFALADNSSATLTTAMIQGHTAGREWEAIDALVRANGGSIVVAPSIDKQFTKRLLVELPSAEV